MVISRNPIKQIIVHPYPVIIYNSIKGYETSLGTHFQRFLRYILSEKRIMHSILIVFYNLHKTEEFIHIYAYTDMDMHFLYMNKCLWKGT